MIHSVKLLSFILFSSFAFNSWSQQSQEIASNYLLQNQSKYQFKLTKENLIISSSHTSQQSGLTHIYFNQAVNGINIYNAITNVAVDKTGKIVHVGNRFVDYKSISSSKALIDQSQAVRSVADHFNLKTEQESKIIQQKTTSSKETILVNTDISNRDIKATLLYIEQDGQLILTWSIAIEKADDQFWWDIKVNAADGTIVEKTSFTLECNFSHNDESCDHLTHDHSILSTTEYLVNHNITSKTTELVDGDYNVCPIPFESPNHGPLSIVNSPWVNNLDPAAHPFDWHNDGATTFTTTRGNNVWAVEDIDGNNNHAAATSPDSELAGTGQQQYTFIPDFNDTPSLYQDAAITNLFYWNNIVHDIMYHYGFDEASGNFQETNDTGNGTGNDAVLADAQDGSDSNNARFFITAEGVNPRMEMYEWTQPAGTTFEVTSPIQAAYETIPASFGPLATFSGTVIEVDDTTGGTHEGCTANPLSNGAALSGNVALIDRGTCTFVEKVTNAENEGAIAVVICNNVPGGAAGMSGTGTTIPSVMISQEDCAILRANLPATIDVVTSTVAPVNRDSDYDNGVIIHEYGHGISTRLTGGASNAGCLSGDEQMGEGWSDYFGLIFTIEPGDTGPQGRGIGTYLQGQSITGGGIRPFPYSSDFGINPMTYASTANVSIPHGVGSVWCTMLWDMTWKLVDLYGVGTDIYDSNYANAGTLGAPSTFGGQNLALQLVMEGLKLQPCSPGFVDGRDAIIAADEALYGGIHVCLIWEVFANRGLGVSANQGSSGSITDNIEAFDVPSIQIEKSVNLNLVAEGDPVSFDFTIKACGSEDNIELTDIFDAAFTISSVVCPSPATYSTNANTLTINHPGLAAGEEFTCTAITTIDTAMPGSSENLLLDDVENGGALWTINDFGGGIADAWSIANTAAQSPTNSWFVSNTNGPNKTSALESQVLTLTDYPIMSFYHQYDTEGGWDGGYIEVSIDNGITWNPITAAAFIQNGYNSVLGANGSNTEIGGKQAWSGQSGGFIKTIISLTDFANEDVIIRIVFGQDNNTNNVGWWIDDISIDNGFVSITNTACVISDQTTIAVCDDAGLIVELIGCSSSSITVMPSSTDVTCHGDQDGSATVVPSGGLAPYTYAWSTGGSLQTESGLAGGTYDVTITDANNCDVLTTVIILEDPPEYTAANGNMLTATQTIDEDYEVDGAIESDQIIQGTPSINVDYDSGTYIELLSGFEVELSSVFHAFIDGCGGVE